MSLVLVPKQAAADHVPQPPQQRIYSVNFAASNQNIWGPAPTDGPSNARYDFFHEQWNAGDTTADIRSFAGMKFGGSIGGNTSGEIGLGAKFSGFEKTKVSVNYPVDVTMAWPAVDSFRAGQTVSIGSNMLVRPGASLTVAPSANDIELLGTFAFSAGAAGNLCFFDCTGDFPIVPQFDIPRQSGKIFALSDLTAACGYVPLTQGCEIDAAKAFALGLPFTGRVRAPNIAFTTTVEADGKSLRSSGTAKDFLNLNLNLVKTITSVTGRGFPLAVNLPKVIPGVEAGVTAFSGVAPLQVTQSQSVRFSPTIQGTLNLPTPVAYKVKTPAGAVVDTGTGNTITFDVGNTVDVTVPAGMAPADVLNATPTFAIKQTANFTNDVNTTFTTDLNSEALKVSLKTPSVEVTPSFVLVPRVCIPLLGCTPEVRVPALRAPSIGVNLGPVWKDTQPIFADTDSSLFDGNRPAWQLGGFTASNGAAIQLNPEYTPVVTATGPAVLNEAQQGTFAFTFSDGDNDPLTYTLEWGDGAVETGTGSAAGTSFNKNHTYADNGTYVVRLTVNDGHSPGVAAHTVTVNNVAPVLSNISITPTLNENGTAAITGTITDPGIRDSFTMQINWGGPAGQPEGTDTFALPAGTTSFARTHQYRDDNPTGTAGDNYTVTVSVTDKDGGSDTKTTSTRVNNVAPTIYAGSDRTIDEGSTTRLGIELFGKNLMQGADAESGTADWSNLTGGFAAKTYGPSGSGDAAAVTFYQLQNGAGPSRSFSGNVSCLVGNSFDGTTTDMNDRVSSIRVPTGMNVTIFQHCHYGGWQETYGPGLWNFPYPDASSLYINQTPLNVTMVNDSTPGYYNDSIGTILKGTQPQFPATGDPDLGTAVAQPDLSPASGILGSWLSANPSLNGYWSGPRAIPSTWPEYHATAILYPVDIPEGGAQLTGDFGADNGIFVWVDGVYKFGAVQPGGMPGAGTYEYPNINLGSVTAGRHYIQVLREDHGGVTGSTVRVRAQVAHGGTLAVDSAGPTYRGTSYFGGGAGTSSATQTISVASISSLVDAGSVTYQASGWFGAVLADGDSAQLTTTFKDGSGATIGTAMIGPVTAADRGNITQLLQRTGPGAVPAGTRTIVLELKLNLNSGSTNQAGADNLSFILLPKPGSRATAGFTDPGLQDTHTVSVTWGDGSPAVTPVSTGVPGNVTLDGAHGYQDNGSFTVNAIVTDDDTGTHTHGFVTTVRNVPPTVTGVEQVFILGRSETKQLATFTDPGALDTHTASIDWGDGSPAGAGTVSETLGNVAGVLTRGSVTGTHAYNLAGPYPRTVLAQVTVRDKDGGTRTIPVKVTVTDLEVPNATMTASPTTITESGTANFTGSFGAIVFPAGATLFTPTYDYVLEFGDGSPNATGAAGPGTNITAIHSYAQDGTYVATLKIRAFEVNRLATYTTVSSVITVNNAAPVIAAMISPTTNEGSTVSVNTTFSDLGVRDTHLATINWGDGSLVEAAAITENAGSGSVTGSHVYTQDGVYTVSVTVIDDAGGVGTGTFTATILNVGPAVSAGPNQTVNEGTPVSVNSLFTDPGADLHKATINWGDGVTEAAPVNQSAKTVAGTHLYANSGVYTVSVCVTDDHIINCGSLVATVTNVAPSVAALANQAANEGDTVTLTTTYSDPGPVDTHTASVNWGDGTTTPAKVDPQGHSVYATHVYAQNGVYTATVTVTDQDGGAGSRSLTVTVNNVSPTVNAGSDVTVGEGSTVSLTTTYSDPGTADTHTATVDWGDGMGMQAATVDGAHHSVSGSHVYADNGTYTVNVCVKDDGSPVCASFKATVLNVAPAVKAGSDQTVNEGQTVTVSATVTDPGPADVLTNTINWGDGTMTSGNTGSHVYVDNGIYAVTVCSVDHDGARACDTLTVTVNNVASTVRAGADQSAAEGDTVAVNATFTDPGTADTHTATITWGDGSSSTATVNEGAKTAVGTHVYADNGTYAVKVCVTDKDGAVGCNSLTATTSNVAPTVTAGANRTAYQGSRVALNPATFTDPGTADTHTASIDWGDGTKSAGTVNEAGHVVTGSHTYASVGTYTVKVCVADDDGGAGCDQMLVKVLNVAPVVYAGADATVDEGQPFEQSGPFEATVYASNFSGGADGAWSTSTTATSPSGERFLGQFGNEAAMLSLNNLPSHGQVTIEFDLYLINSWKGNGNSCCGPNLFDFSVVDGPTLLHATFSNTESAGNHQSFPDSYPGPDHAGGTGAARINTLGYGDSLYHFTYTVPHTDASIAFQFMASNLQSLADQSWGIDNVKVTVPVAGPVFADPGAEAWTATVNYGDGTSAQPLALNANKTFALSHVYADNGTYTVSVTATDSNGGTGSSTLKVTVNNVAPTVVAGPDQTVGEGDTVSLAPSTFNDKGTADTHTATVDWGDGTGVQPAVVTETPFGPPGSTAGANGTVAASHVYADNGTYTVTVTVKDDDGATTTSTLKVTVNNVAPTVVAGPDQTVGEGDTVSLAPSTFNDKGTADTHTATVDWGDGTGVQPAVVTETPFGPPGSTAGANGTVAASHVYADNGVYTVTVTVKDKDGAATASTFKVTVKNVAPTVNAGPDQTINEGETVSLAPATFHDQGTADTHTATVDWGDGTPVQSAAVSETPFGPPGSTSGANGTVSASHAYGDNGVFTVTVTVKDDDGAATASTFKVTVRNLNPKLTLDTSSAINFAGGGPAYLGRQGVAQTHGASAIDPGSDDLTFAWNFGTTHVYFNNGTSPDPHPSAPGTFPFTVSDTASVTYNAPGVYTLGVTVTDDDGGSDAGSLTKLVTGNATRVRDEEWWLKEYREATRPKDDHGKRNGKEDCGKVGHEKDDPDKDCPPYDAVTLQRFLDVLNFASAVYSEKTPAATLTNAALVLTGEPARDKRNEDDRDGRGEELRRARAKAESAALAAWLNWASGAVLWDQPIPIDVDSPDGHDHHDSPVLTPFNQVMAQVESILRNPNATKQELRTAQKLADAVNHFRTNRDKARSDGGDGKAKP